MTYREINKLTGKSITTIGRVVTQSSTEIDNKVVQRGKENTEKVLDWLNGSLQDYSRFCEYLFNERLNPETNREELDKVPVTQLITVFGVWTDKKLKAQEIDMRKERFEHDKNIDDKKYW